MSTPLERGEERVDQELAALHAEQCRVIADIQRLRELDQEPDEDVLARWGAVHRLERRIELRQWLMRLRRDLDEQLDRDEPFIPPSILQPPDFVGFTYLLYHRQDQPGLLVNVTPSSSTDTQVSLTGNEVQLMVILAENYPDRKVARKLADAWENGKDERFVQRVRESLGKKLADFDLIDSGSGHGAGGGYKLKRTVPFDRRAGLPGLGIRDPGVGRDGHGLTRSANREHVHDLRSAEIVTMARGSAVACR